MTNTSDTDATLQEQRKKAVLRLLDELMHRHPGLYYQSTAEIARSITENASKSTQLSNEERKDLQTLTAREIEMILAFRQSS